MAYTYMHGSETDFEWAVEDPTSYGTTPAAAAFNAQAFIRGISTNVNENVERIYITNSAYKFNPHTEVKGRHEPTLTTTMWIAKEGTGTSITDYWITKLPIDYKNLAHSSNHWYVPASTTTANYGNYGTANDQGLLSSSIEVMQKDGAGSGDVGWRFHGSMANRFTLRARRGEKVEFSIDWVAQWAEKISSMTAGTATQATGKPFDWSDCQLDWTGEDDSSTTIESCTGLEFTVDNRLLPKDTLQDQTVPRTIGGFLRGPREISGTLSVWRQNTTGQKWEEIILSATSGATTPNTSIQLGQINFLIEGDATTTGLRYVLEDVVLGELPIDPDMGGNIQELRIPFTARYGWMDILTSDTTPPTNWSQTS